MKSLFQGYLNRREFITKFVISVVIFVAGVFLLNLVSKSIQSVANSYMIVFLFMFLVVEIYGLSLYVRRLRDAGKSPFLALITIIVPLQSLFFLYVLLIPSRKT